jgi:hypothetical protein
MLYTMNSVRLSAQTSMARIVSAADSCQLHRIYKIAFESGKKYVGQTKKLPAERLKEHGRESSKCTLMKTALKTGDKHTLETIAVVGPHQKDVFERVAIALEECVAPNGLNMTVGGPGRKKPDADYDRLSRDARIIGEKLKRGSFVSYDVMFMKKEITMSEEEFNAIRRLS